MKKFLKLLFVITMFLSVSLVAQEVISSGELSISVTDLGKGAELSSIKKGNLELLDTSAPSTFFTIYVDALFLTSTSGWDSVAIFNTGTDLRITLTNPTNINLPESLKAIVTISISGNKSDWDISVTGLGESTLNKVSFPYLNLKADGNDYFLLPHYSGKLIKNPKANSINYTLSYPRGWSSTMQFSAYYNDNYGIYLGTHDPKASLKEFIVKKNLFNGFKFENAIPIPNMSLAGNDWELSGVFCLELFEGDWYDASQIYKKWASEEAEYWPKESVKRNLRQNAIGNLGVWTIYSDVESESQLRTKINSFANYMKVPIGVHWYRWNNKAHDEDYPFMFPERDNMAGIVTDLQQAGNISFMPYTNGRIFDKDRPEYTSLGIPGATKNADGDIYSSSFGGNNFAIMCPTYKPYQDVIADSENQLTERIGCAGAYIDQITASSVKQCMDPTHNHTLGGGHFWRDGYKEMLQKTHNALSDGKYVTGEGCCDYLADEVDGFLTDGWTTDNLVPAFQAVYSGKVQLFGTRTGTSTYNQASFYCKLSQSFINGIQPGRFSTWMVSDPNAQVNAAPYVRRIANMRYKLLDYLAFGEMLKPIVIDRTNIPNITSTWVDYGQEVEVTVSALQSSFWKNVQKDKVVVLFANASMTQQINFKFDFDGNSYGVNGQLRVQKITENSDGEISSEENIFSKDIIIQPMGVEAFIIEPDSITSISKEDDFSITYKLNQNYPNPFNPTTFIEFSIPITGYTELAVYNVLGQKVTMLVNRELLSGSYKFQFDATNLSSGIYFYKLQSNDYTQIKKMLLLK